MKKSATGSVIAGCLKINFRDSMCLRHPEKHSHKVPSVQSQVGCVHGGSAACLAAAT